VKLEGKKVFSCPCANESPIVTRAYEFLGAHHTQLGCSPERAQELLRTAPRPTTLIVRITVGTHGCLNSNDVHTDVH